MIHQTQSPQQTNGGEASNSKGSAQFVSMKSRRIAKLKNKEYRDAFVASQISVGLPFQIRALREQRGWNQSKLASEAGMLQPRISAMERPGESKFNLETLRRIASAFDVALEVRFVPFSSLIGWSEKFNPDSFQVPSFAEDTAEQNTPKNSVDIGKFAEFSAGTEFQGIIGQPWSSGSFAPIIQTEIDRQMRGAPTSIEVAPRVEKKKASGDMRRRAYSRRRYA